MRLGLCNEKKSPSYVTTDSIELKNTKIPKIDDNLILVVNPQGVVGKKAVEHMGYGTCIGGQIPYVMNLGKSLSKIEQQADSTSLFGTLNKRLGRQHHIKSRIASQQVSDQAPFDKKFSNKNELSGDYGVKRFPFKKDGIYLDKEDVSLKRNVNTYYENLPNWANNVASKYLEKSKIPGNIVLNYWDSFVAYTNILKKWTDNGMNQKPKVVAIPHSLGYRKLLSILKDEVRLDLNKKLKSKEITLDNISNELIKEITNLKLEKLMNDPKYLFPQRILSERLMFSQADIKGSLNAKKELDEQLLTGPYVIPFKDYPTVKENIENIKVTVPGIDTELFGINKTKEKIGHEKFALDQFNKRIESDISVENRNKPVVLGLGRLNFDKNFHGLIQAFKSSPELREKANIVMVINGPDKNENKNFVKEMQDLLGTNNENEKAIRNGDIKLKNFTGSTLEQLINIAKILKDSPELDGKWTAVSLPDGKDYAGLQRSLGRDKRAVSGLFSFKEPYGLAPFESANCGIPVVVSNGSGAKDELETANARIFDPTKSIEIANALNDTFNNFDEIRKNQMSLASKKGWDSTAKNLYDFMRLDSKKSIGNTNYSNVAIDIYDNKFIEDAKSLLRDTINYELEKGVFKDLKN